MLAGFAASERISLKTTKNRWKHLFPHYKSMGVIFIRSTTDNSILSGIIWPKFARCYACPQNLQFKMVQINSNQDIMETSPYKSYPNIPPNIYL